VATIIDDAKVRELLTMPGAIEALRRAYAAFADGRVLESSRSNLLVPTGFLRLMAAAWPEEGVVGYKEFHRCNGLVRYTYHLFDSESGEALALIDANHLTALRTGACGGLAAELLAAPDASVLGVIGSGAEARSQIAAIRAVRNIRRVRVYSRRPERRELLCAELSDVDAVPVERPEDVLDGAQILAVATNTAGSGPALEGAWLGRPGMHINSIGSTLPTQREIDAEVWARCDRIVLDAALLLEESGDAIAAREAGTLRRGDVVTLGEVVAGTAVGRSDAAQRTMYKSVGSAVQDLALALLAWRGAEPRRDELPRVPDFHRVAVMEGG
jgi:ornithine cyclodeaminase/alanine dehydrogenase